MNYPVIHETNLHGMGPLKRGKVRDLYERKDRILIISTDRISAFDFVLPDGIPFKGIVLNLLSEFWFKATQPICPNHLITTDYSEIPNLHPSAEQHWGPRVMWVQKAEPTPVECVVRGYIAGSGWRAYQDTQSICGIELPSGIVESERFGSELFPIFTPATKAEHGEHDENISFDRMVEVLDEWLAAHPDLWDGTGGELAEELRDTTIRLYRHAEYRLGTEANLILADSKIEFGIVNKKIIVIDELFTPDSSRFWPLAQYVPGKTQHAFDKEYVRGYLADVVKWNKQPPAPPLTEEVMQQTVERYKEAYRRITGQTLDEVLAS